MSAVQQEPEALFEFIHERATITETGCWEWPHLKNDGYGVTTFRGQRWRVHRLTWHHLKTPLSKATVVHHKCANRACCNPDHLQATTAHANNAEMMARQALLATIAVLEDEVHSLVEENIELHARLDRDHPTGEEQ